MTHIFVWSHFMWSFTHLMMYALILEVYLKSPFLCGQSVNMSYHI